MFELRVGNDLDLDQVIEVYRASTLGQRRPLDSRKRMATMLQHSNLVVTAWEGELMLGIARSLSDFAYATYLSDLAVRVSHQRQGIGRALIRRTQEEAGPDASLILLSAPAADAYYPHIGFIRSPPSWTLPAQDKLDRYVAAGARPRTDWLIDPSI